MKIAQSSDLDSFHDGLLHGFLIDQKTVSVFLSTEDARDLVIMAHDVVAMVADGFRAGNVIFDVLIKASADITVADVAETYGLSDQPSSVAVAGTLLEKAREQSLQLLEINPSY